LTVGTRTATTSSAIADPGGFYDDRYRHGYLARRLASGFDACLCEALRWGLRTAREMGPVTHALDYGCGRGRHMDLIAEELSLVRIHGCDISEVAVESCRRQRPQHDVRAIAAGEEPFEPGSFDVVTCVEVIEHVTDADETARVIGRMLRPGGVAVVTSPCANRGSGPWLYNLLFGGFEQTPDGTGRFATDEPAHLRRLTSRRLGETLARAGLQVEARRWWDHFFTPVADNVPGARSLPLGARVRIARLDWSFLRHLPNGGAVVVVARRRP
jgi:SAM-dependent methyltransferase